MWLGEGVLLRSSVSCVASSRESEIRAGVKFIASSQTLVDFLKLRLRHLLVWPARDVCVLLSRDSIERDVSGCKIIPCSVSFSFRDITRACRRD